MRIFITLIFLLSGFSFASTDVKQNLTLPAPSLRKVYIELSTGKMSFANDKTDNKMSVKQSQLTSLAYMLHQFDASYLPSSSALQTIVRAQFQKQNGTANYSYFSVRNNNYSAPNSRYEMSTLSSEIGIRLKVLNYLSFKPLFEIGTGLQGNQMIFDREIIPTLYQQGKGYKMRNEFMSVNAYALAGFDWYPDKNWGLFGYYRVDHVNGPAPRLLDEAYTAHSQTIGLGILMDFDEGS